MTILAIDTSSSQGSLCLVHAQIDERQFEAKAQHSETLVSAIDELLTSAGLKPSDLKSVLVGLGPGSFTGLRIGLATAKGLCFGTGAKLLGFDSMGLWALGHDNKAVAVVLNAYGGEIYGALYHNGTVLIAPSVFKAIAFVERCQELQPTCVFVGPEVVPGIELKLMAPRAFWAIDLLRARLAVGESDPLALLVPTYVKSFQVASHSRNAL